jgi:hypothetical protein
MRLVEVMVALMVGFGLLAAGWRVLARGAVAGRELLDRSEFMEVQRLAPWVLELELAGARAGIDWAEHADGLAVRAYRGWGLPCAGPGNADDGDGLVVGYQGLRLPEPDKDSLQLTRADGLQRVVALTSVAALDPPPDVSCPPEGRVLHLGWAEEALDETTGWPGAGRVAFLRLFEHGLYAVDDAFRYRRGAGGRQPLTGSVLDAAGSSLRVRGGRPVLELAPERAGGRPPARGFVR